MCLSSNCLKKLNKQESVKRKTRGQELHIGKWKTLEGAEASSSFDHISTMPTQKKAIFIRSRTEFINYLSDAWRWAALSSDRWLETWNFPVQLYLAFGSVLCSAKILTVSSLWLPSLWILPIIKPFNFSLLLSSFKLPVLRLPNHDNFILLYFSFLVVFPISLKWRENTK